MVAFATIQFQELPRVIKLTALPMNDVEKYGLKAIDFSLVNKGTGDRL